MSGFLVAAAEAIRGVQCQVLGANEFILGAIGRFNPVTRATAPLVLNPIRRLLGCDPENDPQTPPPPFEGGQCFGAIYSVNIQTEYIRESTGAPFSFNQTRRCRGPLVAFFTEPFSPEDSNLTFVYQANAVSSSSSTNPGQNPPGTVVTRRERTSAPDSIDGLYPTTGVTVTLISGADDCGDPPPIYPPPTPFPIDIDVTFQPDFGPEITVPITVNFNPFEINFNGDVEIPFDFSFGDFNFNGDVTFEPEVNVRINPPRFPRGTGGGADELPPGDPENEVEPLEAEEKIIGVVVNSQITNSGKVSSYSSPEIPDIFVPRLGSVKFAYSFGGATFWSSDIDVKDSRTFIECPFSQGADAVVASPQIGVSMSAVPIRGYAIATTNDIKPA